RRPPPAPARRPSRALVFPQRRFVDPLRGVLQEQARNRADHERTNDLNSSSRNALIAVVPPISTHVVPSSFSASCSVRNGQHLCSNAIHSATSDGNASAPSRRRNAVAVLLTSWTASSTRRRSVS